MASGMTMEQQAQRIAELEERIDHYAPLEAQHERVKRERDAAMGQVERTQEEVEQLKDELSRKASQIAELEEQVLQDVTHVRESELAATQVKEEYQRTLSSVKSLYDQKAKGVQPPSL